MTEKVTIVLSTDITFVLDKKQSENSKIIEAMKMISVEWTLSKKKPLYSINLLGTVKKVKRGTSPL